MSKLLKDYIYCKNIFSKQLCKKIIKEYQSDYFDRDSHYNQETRHLGSIDISSTATINKTNSFERAKIVEDIKERLQEIINQYMNFINVKSLPIEQSSPFSLRQMKKGDWYGQHDDDGVGEATGDYKFTVSVCLNDNYKGGDFTFFNDEIVYKFKVGDVIMFPSSFMFPHAVKKITKGTRYQLLLWLR